MKLGIFGGTFSPPHRTHIEMAMRAVTQLGLDKLFVLPNGVPPHKPCKENSADRLAMTKLAFGGLPKTEIDTFELGGGASYTVSTLEHFKKLFPGGELFLVIGGDSLRDFSAWNRPDKIAKLARLAVCRRAGADYERDKLNAELNYGASVVEVAIEQSEISSTRLRVDYQFGRDCSDRVPEEVNAYIMEKGLYDEFRPAIEKVKTYLSPKRFEHTYHVVCAGMELPTKADRDKIFLACLLHDVAKEIPTEKYGRYGFVPDADMPKKVIHAPLGARVAETDFGVKDKEILDAIEFHTTARPNMTELDKVVYVADKIEESRPYPTKHLMAPTLGEIFVNCLVDVARVTEKKYGAGRCHPLTREALNFYLK